MRNGCDNRVIANARPIDAASRALSRAGSSTSGLHLARTLSTHDRSDVGPSRVVMPKNVPLETRGDSPLARPLGERPCGLIDRGYSLDRARQRWREVLCL